MFRPLVCRVPRVHSLSLFVFGRRWLRINANNRNSKSNNNIQSQLITHNVPSPSPPSCYVFGSERFSSRSCLLSRCQSILAANAPSGRLMGQEEIVIKELFKHHPQYAAKVGPGLRGLFVRPLLGDLFAFHAERVDGTVEPFSHHHIIKHMTFNTNDNASAIDTNYRRADVPAPVVGSFSPSSVTHPKYQPPAHLVYRAAVPAIKTQTTKDEVGSRVVSGPHAELISRLFDSSRSYSQSELLATVDALVGQHADSLARNHWIRILFVLHICHEDERARSLLASLEATRGFVADHAFYHRLLTLFSDRGDVAAAFALFKQMCERHMEWAKGPTIHLLLRAIRRGVYRDCLSSVRFTSPLFPESHREYIIKGTQIADELFALPPDSVKLNRELLYECVWLNSTAMQFDKALSLLQEARRRDTHLISQALCNEFLSFCVYAKHYSPIADTVSLLLDCGLKADLTTYILVMRAQSRAGNWQKAVDIVKELEQIHGNLKEESLAHAELTGLDSVIEETDDGPVRRLPPLNVGSFYYYALAACGEAQQFEPAAQLWRAILDKDLRQFPGFFTPNLLYAALRVGLHSKTYAFTIDLWNDFMRLHASNQTLARHFKGADVISADVFEAYAGLSRFEEAHRVYEFLLSANWPMGVHTYANYIGLAIKAADDERARALLADMDKRGVQKNYFFYAALIRTCNATERAHRVRQIVREFENTETANKQEINKKRQGPAAVIAAAKAADPLIGPLSDRIGFNPAHVYDSVFTALLPHQAELAHQVNHEEYHNSPAAVYLAAMEVYAPRLMVGDLLHCWRRLIKRVTAPSGAHLMSALRYFTQAKQFAPGLEVLALVRRQGLFVSDRVFRALFVSVVGNEADLRRRLERYEALIQRGGERVATKAFINRGQTKYEKIYEQVEAEYEDIREQAKAASDFVDAAASVLQRAIGRYRALEEQIRLAKNERAALPSRPAPPLPEKLVLRLGAHDLVELCKARRLHRLPLADLEAIQQRPDLMADEPLKGAPLLEHAKRVDGWVKEKLNKYKAQIKAANGNL